MSIRVPSMSRTTLAALFAAITLAPPAMAKPPRAKTKPAQTQLERHVVKVGRAHIEPSTPTPIKKAKLNGGNPSTGPGAVQPKDPGEIEFTLSANTPNVPYRGRLRGFYPREWRTAGDHLGPGGEVWLSQNQVGNLSYAVAELDVEPGHEYEVTLCTTSGSYGLMVRATVGDTTHTFKTGDAKCDLTLVLQPQEAGKASVKLDFANPPSEHGANAFAVLAVQVVRR